jgi:hypothetical protein
MRYDTFPIPIPQLKPPRRSSPRDTAKLRIVEIEITDLKQLNHARCTPWFRVYMRALSHQARHRAAAEGETGSDGVFRYFQPRWIIQLGMKVRQAYEGRVIEARSSELKDGGWDCEFSIEEHETTGITETAFYVPGKFPTAEAAIEAAVTAGVRKIDSGFEYKSVVEYRQRGPAEEPQLCPEEVVQNLDNPITPLADFC